MTALASRDAIHTVFGHFRDELDDHNDRRERLIKSSRDITNASKKVIFLLHRVMTEDASEADDRVLARRAAANAQDKLRDIQKMFAAIRDELAGDRFWRYQRNVSPGLQEYIEALSFAHYLERERMISYEEVQKTLCAQDGTPHFPLPVEDYLLGLSDLTGELMRFAISSISRRGGRSKASQVCTFVRACRVDFESWTPFFRDLRKKQAVTSQSLEKIEDVAYAIAVRSSEYDLPLELLDDIVERTVISSGYGIAHSEDRKRRRTDDLGGDDD
ncbi:Translin [Obba rivulosa]|uniref:Translin n=1 Tax=Obba rivulosa TaxID=1052685 RepID=A0A8E2DVY4_9APHY|nr:Translin [Obba rivulosa]